MMELNLLAFLFITHFSTFFFINLPFHGTYPSFVLKHFSFFVDLICIPFLFVF